MQDDTLRLSKLHPYSYGIAAANLALNSWILEVTPIEDLTMADGQITDNVTQLQSSGKDATGTSYQTNATQSATVTATWLPVGQPNRMTPPNVRRGEHLMIYRFADDTSKYYWNTLRNDLAFRSLETVVYGFSGSPTDGAKPDETNTYLFGISAHQKKIWIHTPKANKEPFGYDITLDTGNGVFTFTDDINNFVKIDSQNHIVHLENADGSFLELNKTILNAQTTDSMNWKTKAWNLSCETISANASSSASLQTEQNSLKATTNIMDTNTQHNGDIATGAGGTGSTGKMQLAGNMVLDGTLDVKQEATFESTLNGTVGNFSVAVNAPNNQM